MIAAYGAWVGGYVISDKRGVSVRHVAGGRATSQRRARSTSRVACEVPSGAARVRGPAG